jgi:hypothetical protein
MPPVGNLPQFPLVARRPVRAYGCHRLRIYPSSAYDRTRRGQRRKGDVPLWESTPAVPTTRLAEVNDGRTMSRFGNLPPGSACDQTRRGQRRKGDVPVWNLSPSSAHDRTRRGQRRKHDIPVWESTPSSAYYQTRRGQRRKDDVPVSRLMLCGNLFPCRVQNAQWPRNDEIATRNRHE